MEFFVRKLPVVLWLLLVSLVYLSAHADASSLRRLSVAILEAASSDYPAAPMQEPADDAATLELGLLAQAALRDVSDATWGTLDEVTVLQEQLEQEIIKFAQEHHLETVVKKPLTRILSNNQDMQVGGNLAIWGTTTIETGLVINNNNGGTVAAPALQLSSFTGNQALLVTTTAGLNILQISTDVTQPALSIANSSGVFASTTSGARILVNGSVSSTGGQTITSGTLVISAGNIILPAANAAGTQGLIELGGTTSATNVNLYEFGTRNFFAGNGTVNASVTGADNISIGTSANSTLTTGSNTIAIGNGALATMNNSIAIGTLATATVNINAIAIGNDAVATATYSIAIGSFATTGLNANRAIAIGSTSSTGGAAPTVTGENGIALGSASASGAGPQVSGINAMAIGSAGRTGSVGVAGPVASGLAAIALGASDGTTVGASASGTRSVAIGSGSVATQADSIILGNPNNISVGVAIGTSTPSTTFTTTARLTIVTSGNQNAIATSNGTISAPAYSFISTNTSVGMYCPGQNQLGLVTSNTTRLLIDGTGSVSYFSKYKVHAFVNATVNPFTSGTNIIFNSVASPGYDINGNFATGSGTYTAPLSGYYLVSANVSLTNNSGNANSTITLVKNGTTQTSFSATQNNESANRTFNLSFAAIIQLNQNDTLNVQESHTAGVLGVLLNDTHISIHFMSTV